MKIKIKKKNVELKYSIRAMIAYENITEKSFNPTSFTDILTFAYCIVLTSTKDYTLTFDEFIEYVDDNPTFVGEFTDWLTSQSENQNQLKKN